jgi:hypothetical protein
VKALLVVLAACDVTASGADGPNPCLSLYPALRVETTCPGTLRVTIDGHDLAPDPRTVTLGGATLVPWPAWVRAGMPSVVHVGAATFAFTAAPYTCQVVTVACP